MMLFFNKRTLLIFFSLLLFRVLCVGQSEDAIVDNTPDQIILSVTEDMATSVSVSWRTSVSVPISKIQFVKENSLFNIEDSAYTVVSKSELLDFKGMKTWHHSALIKELQPHTTYAYRVGNDHKWSEWINFKTINDKEEKIKFIYFGDVQSNIKSLWTRVAKQAVKSVPDAEIILYAGDIVNRGNNLNEWEEWFEASGNMHQAIPIMPAAGNHDHGDSEFGKYEISAYWNKQFKVPSNGADGLEGTSYYVDVKNVRFVVFNTEMFNTYEKDRDSQMEWLRKVLITNNQKWLIMLFHHPIYSTKKNRDNVELRSLVKPLIDEFKVDLVLQGHDHTYARGKEKIPMLDTRESHATYVVSVSGPKMSVVKEADWMDRSASFTQLFHGIEIDNNKLIFSSYKVNGDLMDSFTILKKGNRNTISY